MHPTIDSQRDKIVEICRRFGVARLELFGSAATAEFDPATSDFDFLVEFRTGCDLGPWMSQYFELREELGRVLGREVDLVMAGAPRNPYFVRDLNRTRRLLYAE